MWRSSGLSNRDTTRKRNRSVWPVGIGGQRMGMTRPGWKSQSKPEVVAVQLLVGLSTCSRSTHPIIRHQRERRTPAPRASPSATASGDRRKPRSRGSAFRHGASRRGPAPDSCRRDDGRAHRARLSPRPSSPRYRPGPVPRWIVGIGESESGEWVDSLLHDQTGPQSLSRSLLRERDVVLLTLVSDREAAGPCVGGGRGMREESPFSVVDSTLCSP
jgi:hypothetical protein